MPFPVTYHSILVACVRLMSDSALCYLICYFDIQIGPVFHNSLSLCYILAGEPCALVDMLTVDVHTIFPVDRDLRRASFTLTSSILKKSAGTLSSGWIGGGRRRRK